MRRAIRHTLVAVLLATAAAVGTPVSGETDLEGVYAVAGVNPDGSEYRGFVHMVRRGETLLVSWVFPHTSSEAVVVVQASVGVGIVSNGMLAVSYHTARTAGVVIYRFEEDGKRLAGRWTLVGDEGVVHTETLTRLPATDSEPVDADPPAPPRRSNPVGKSLSL